MSPIKPIKTMTNRPRDARGRFVKASPTPTQSGQLANARGNSIENKSKSNEHDMLHQTLRQVNRMAEGNKESSVKESMKIERFRENTLSWLFVAFVVWILWAMFVS